MRVRGRSAGSILENNGSITVVKRPVFSAPAGLI